MQTEDEDKIIKTMKEVCKEQQTRKEYFNTLKKLYNHISKHENEPSDNRAQSIKGIINSVLEVG